MSVDCDARSVNTQLLIETEALIEEITRYLAVVDAFRAADAEPTWRPEPAIAAVRLEAPVPAATSRVAH